MKKEKLEYRYHRHKGKPLQAKREIPYGLKLSARLLLDKICFDWNKSQLEAEINRSIDMRDKETFLKLSKAYKHFIWE